MGFWRASYETDYDKQVQCEIVLRNVKQLGSTVESLLFLGHYFVVIDQLNNISYSLK